MKAKEASVIGDKIPAQKTDRAVVGGDRTGLFLWILTLLLVVFGTLMVSSASSVSAFVNEHGAFSESLKHVVYVAIGFALMWFASKRSIRFWKKWAFTLFFLAMVLQGLVFSPLGVEIWGNRNWVRIGPVTMQPSEMLKLTMIIVLGVVISIVPWATEKNKTKMFKLFWAPGLALASTVRGQDFGTAMIMVMILFGILLFTGFSRRFIGGLTLAAGVFAVVMVFASPSRLERISRMFDKTTDTTGLDWQPLHGTWALASGGLFGVGPGQSKAKWLWLPSADNDYIFAIIGEEFGFVGALGVIIAFVLLFVLMLRVLQQSKTVFGTAVVSGVMIWITGQAFVNIAVVLRLLPVLGVPLPLISAGGSSLIACMAAIGVVISVSRDAAETGQGKLEAR